MREPDRSNIRHAARIVTATEAREWVAEGAQRLAVPASASVRRDAVHLGLVTGSARQLGELAPAVGLAVGVERRRHDAEAREHLGLATRRKPDPVPTEQDRAGRDAFHRFASQGELANIGRQVAVVDQRHAALDITAGEEHEVRVGELGADRARGPTPLRELDRDDPHARAEYEPFDPHREAWIVVRRGPDERDHRPRNADRGDTFAVITNGLP